MLLHFSDGCRGKGDEAERKVGSAMRCGFARAAGAGVRLTASSSADHFLSILQGYALVEYETEDEAKAAIAGASGSQLLEQTLTVDFAFLRPPVG